jgi:MerR family transcriptional regulator/heat shock protein HspR
MNTRRKKGYYSISAVAKMFSVHQQTIRLYEKQGLIAPKRSAGNTRLFSDDDVDRLEEVIHLTHTLGINLAGVEMILKLKRQISKMQKNMNQLFDETQEDLEKQAQQSKLTIQTSAQRLVDIKQSNDQIPSHQDASKTASPDSIEIEQWDVDYEDN